MSFITRRFLWTAAFLLLGRAAAAEPLTIRWMVQDMPPHFNFIGGRAPQRPEELGHGEVDGFLRLLIQQMPADTRHEFVDAGLLRFEAMVRQQGLTLCSMLHLRTAERAGWLYFTSLYPALAARELHVIVRRDRLPLFESSPGGPPQQLAALLKRKNLDIVLPRDRSFGPRIDALLHAPGVRAPQTVVTGRSLHLLAMLRAGRMDYTLEYPAVLDEFLRGSGSGSTAGGNEPDLVALPLAEGRSTAVATAACSRSPAGRQAIEAIDLAVRRIAQDPGREALLRSWRGESLDEADRARLRRYFDERARAGAQID